MGLVDPYSVYICFLSWCDLLGWGPTGAVQNFSLQHVLKSKKKKKKITTCGLCSGTFPKAMSELTLFPG